MAGRRKSRPLTLSSTGEFLERSHDRDPRLGHVLRIASHLSAQLTLEELLELIMHGLTDLLDAERSTLFLLSDDATYLWSKVALGDEIHEIRMKVGEGIAGWVAETGRQVNVKDAYQDPRFDPAWDQQNNYRTRSLLCLPIRNRAGDIMGVAQVLNKRSGYFTVDDAMMLRTIMAMAAISIVNARLYNALLTRNLELLDAQRALQERVREIDLLHTIEREMSEAADLDEAIETLLQRIGDILPCAALELALVGNDGSMVIHRLGDMGAGIEPIRAERPIGFAGKAIQSRKEIDVAGLDDLLRLRLADEESLPLQPNSGLCIPLRADDRILGALCLFGQPVPRRQFDAGDAKLISLLGAHASRLVAQRIARERDEREERLNSIGSAIAGILHDFKTPMTIASGYAQMMADCDDPEERTKLATTVLRQIRRVSQMSRDVLAFARGASDVFVQRVLVNDFAEETRELIGQMYRDTGLDWEVRANYRGVARFDRMKLLRVVQNLARNARDALLEQPEDHPRRFCFVLDEEGDDLVLTFSDTGPGVPVEFQHRLFEAFATAGKKDGTGLGLAMVKQFAEVHGGGVHYRDTPGGGATFEIRIARETRGASR